MSDRLIQADRLNCFFIKIHARFRNQRARNSFHILNLKKKDSRGSTICWLVQTNVRGKKKYSHWSSDFPRSIFTRLSRRTKFIVRSVDNAIQSVPETRANPLSSKEYSRAFIRKCGGLPRNVLARTYERWPTDLYEFLFTRGLKCKQSRGRTCDLNRETFHRIHLNIKKLIEKGVFCAQLYFRGWLKMVNWK